MEESESYDALCKAKEGKRLDCIIVLLYYVICTVCGCKLLKANEGSEIETFCRKCNAKLYIEINDGTVSITRITTDTRKKECV